ncbi:MAG: hypothetical protein FWG29_05045 [Treponema sp.]|nr:hypothetical protein [Treponema sp.]
MTKRFFPNNLAQKRSCCKSLVFLLLVLLLPGVSLFAYDWGLLADQTAAIADTAGNLDNTMDGFSYTGTLTPWVSIPFGSPGDSHGNLYLSAGITVEYQRVDTIFIPELLRTELSYRFGEGTELHAGRMIYTDPLGFIADGLFDGAQVTMGLGGFGNLGIGAWYTGFLYKNTARITMTEADLTTYYLPLDYDKFADTYFAPRRILAAIDWEKPGLSEKFRLKGFIIGQFDLSGNDETYHSQYLGAKFIYPINSFIFDLGVCMELAEHKTAGETKTLFSFAGEAGISWLLPTKVQDRLTLTGRFSSGTPDKEDSSFAAFIPITTQYQGDILRAKLSGLSMIRMEYSIRPAESLIVNLADSYFILSDLGTYANHLGAKDGHFLGNEISGSVIWFPFSDLQLNLLGGVFLPSWGNALKDSNAQWRIELNAKLAIF